MPPERAQYEIARPTFFYLEEDAGGPESLAREEVRARIRAQVSTYSREGAALADSSSTIPQPVQARIVEMLGAYWEQSFAAEWARLEPTLREEVEQRGSTSTRSRCSSQFGRS